MCSVQEARHKDHVVYDFIYVKCPESRLVVVGYGEDEEWEVKAKGFPFRVMKIF